MFISDTFREEFYVTKNIPKDQDQTSLYSKLQKTQDASVHVITRKFYSFFNFSKIQWAASTKRPKPRWVTYNAPQSRPLVQRLSSTSRNTFPQWLPSRDDNGSAGQGSRVNKFFQFSRDSSSKRQRSRGTY